MHSNDTSFLSLNGDYFTRFVLGAIIFTAECFATVCFLLTLFEENAFAKDIAELFAGTYIASFALAEAVPVRVNVSTP